MRVDGKLALFGLILAGCQSTESTPSPPKVSLEDIGILAQFGDSSDAVLGILDRPEDAVFLDNAIAVLDRSDPYVRVFDLRGKYITSLVPDGGGPGEAHGPVAIEAFGSHGLLIAEPKRLSVLDSVGRWVRGFGPWAGMFRGAVASCRRELIALHTAKDEAYPHAALTKLKLDESPPDLLLTLDTIRGFSRRPHPFFAEVDDGHVVLYTEEARLPRLLQLDCDTGDTTSIALNELGAPQWWESGGGGGWNLHPPEPPYPAGVGITPLGVVWAVQELDTVDTKVDSLTRVSWVAAGTPDRNTVMLLGWLDLVDTNSDGLMLWIRHGDYGSQVIVVDSDSLSKFLL